MFRLIGFLIGSITSVIIILMIVGMPNFHLDDKEEDQARYDEALEMLRAKQSEFESVTDKLSEDVQRVAESVESGLESLGEAASPGAAAQSTPARLQEGDAVVSVVGASPAAPVTATATVESHWYSFWNPFRSEIAARGFVSRLESVTGIDYRVVKVKTGVYEVAFEYRDDDEKRAKIAQIATATGLDLPAS